MIDIKMKSGKYMIPVKVLFEKGRIFFRFNYNKALMEEIKAMEGARWHGHEDPPKKMWSVKDTPRNRFQLAFLCGENPYGWYDHELIDYVPLPRRCPKCRGKGCGRCINGEAKHYQHQIEMIQHGLTRRQCIFSCEMGCLAPETLIKCSRTNQVRTIEQWVKSNQYPTVKSYDSKGNIVLTRPVNYVKKTMPLVQIPTNIGILTVGENHLFLTKPRGLILARHLTINDSLVMLNLDHEISGDFTDSSGNVSIHLVPDSFKNLQLIAINNVSHQPENIVYDLTIPIYGNYFDALGINHQNTGKTLAGIEILDHVQPSSSLWIGPRSALASVKLEFEQWQAKVWPEFYTYESLKKLIEFWPAGKKSPQIVFFDEASRVKNHSSQRSQAAKILADMIREDWGKDGYIILMSGSPAPKSPADWWQLCEIACPGFIREGTVEKFKQRLGLIVNKESVSGGVYPHLITWKDDERKCNVCGEYKDGPSHDVFGNSFHPYEPSKNEIAYLYQRMKGLVLVKFKKSCLDLPEKQYVLERVKPDRNTLNAAKLIQARAARTITALTLLRELSDGFQYVEEDFGTIICPVCKGTCEAIIASSGQLSSCPHCDSVIDATCQFCPDCGNFIEVSLESYSEPTNGQLGPCIRCGGSGEVPKYARRAIQVDCPKADRLKEIIEDHEDIGRIVIYAGFSGSVDRCVQIAKECDWKTIRVDGRGWHSEILGNDQELLKAFQGDDDRIAFIGQPGAAGMGLTLTASPTIVYYSNDFNAESRIQSEDRIHRPGMDLNRGATIIDLIHLPTDEYVLENLKKKRRLQDMSLGQFQESIKAYSNDFRVT